ncbi:MAG TPA: redoxin domain-containing protein [Kofleriaceae bacterium]|jgi:peroxiredoxin|nr:redoxin domain-containing protein [Kofleriaceae bacterium]
MRWLAIVVLVACTHAIAPTTPSPTTAAEWLARVAATYHALPAYADRGTVVDTFSDKHQNHITFETAFARPDKLRFQYDNGTAFVAWNAPPRARMWQSVDTNVVHEARDIEQALAIFSGVSHGAAYVVPSLLGAIPQGTAFTELADATIVGSEAIDGHACARVRGKYGEDLAAVAELWIDRSSFLVRQVAVHTGGVDTVMHYEPRTTVTDADFAPPVDMRTAKLEPYTVPAWLGLSFEPKSPRVTMALDGAPGAKAGIVAGDQLVTVDGHAVTSAEDVRAKIAPHRAGERIPVVIERDGKTIALTIELAEKPDEHEMQRDQLVGKPAPAFDLPTIDSARASLGALAGHVVVLDFWATWCGPCEVELPELVAMAARHPNARFIGISDEDEPAIKTYMTSHAFSYPVARDDGDRVNAAYFVTALPTIVIVDKAGIVREVSSGFGGGAHLESVIKRYE